MVELLVRCNRSCCYTNPVGSGKGGTTMLMKYFVGLVAVYLVGATDPNLLKLALHLYLTCIAFDVVYWIITKK